MLGRSNSKFFLVLKKDVLRNFFLVLKKGVLRNFSLVLKKGVLRNFAKFTENTCVRVSFTGVTLA